MLPPPTRVVALGCLAVVSAVACNGNAALCSRRYSNVTHVGAHNSAFVGNGPAHNQYTDATDVLGRGIRFLQAQTHRWFNPQLQETIQMCHTNCLLLDEGILADYLGPLKTWLDANPDEVVTLLLTNKDAIPVARFADEFGRVGLDEYVYGPGKRLAPDEWPTLQEMIDRNDRLVVFMDYHTDTNEVPWILDEFSYFWETPFDSTDANFDDCSIHRPGGSDGAGLMAMVNHYLDVDIFGVLVPDQLRAGSTNSVASIAAQANLCTHTHGRVPNVILQGKCDGRAECSQPCVS